ncbi:MAG: CCA tRNA nucleotidyltransferase [Dehalococcoidales bacterium]|nr:CCA tRNA nucleotidyltransferase [Dehalococcoidales bacterium]
MERVIDLNKYLPESITHYLDIARDAALELGYDIYLVGGAVRDILLKDYDIHDIDLAIEGDTAEFADLFRSKIEPAGFIYHEPFNTATFTISDDLHIDIAMCRTESYPQKAVLPIVEPAELRDDLKRRDFTINAMAISLTEGNKLVDIFSGEKDLKNGIIRILHKKSFLDDPTRIWRAVRYACRFDFEIEPSTLTLIERDKGNLSLLTPERRRYEMKCVLNEKEPVKTLQKAKELGLIDLSAELIKRLEDAGELDELTFMAVYLEDKTDDVILRECEYWGLNSHDRDILMEVKDIKSRTVQKQHSKIYKTLKSYPEKALEIARRLTRDSRMKDMLSYYLDTARETVPFLTGDDLKELGYPEGKLLGEKLQELFMLQLDGEIDSREDAIARAIKL